MLDVIRELFEFYPEAFAEPPFEEAGHRLAVDAPIDQIWSGEGPPGGAKGASPWDALVLRDEKPLPPPRHSEWVEEETRSSGTKTLAFYLSYHFDRTRWGIYVLEDGLSHVAAKCVGDESMDPLYAYQRAFKLLFLHEYFHFLTDVGATVLEHVLSRPLYIPFRQASSPWSDLEEALANAFAASRMGSPTKWVFEFMSGQPHGYNDYRYWMSSTNRAEGRRLLIQRLMTPWDHGEYLPLGELLIDSRSSSVNYWNVPVYMIRSYVPTAPAVFRFITSIDTLYESDRFQKDATRLPAHIGRKWLKTRAFLSSNIHHAGLDFKKLKNCDGVFRARVDQGYRVTLRPGTRGSWELLRIGTHADLDRKPI